jgi:putative ABC transport system substrate-binding protein
MRRRGFITFLGGAGVWPLAARAQRPAMPVVGFLSGASSDGYAERTRAFHQGLSEAGYEDGRNVAVEYRWAEGQYDRLPAMATDLVHRQVAVITANLPGALAAKAATQTIPIIFMTGADPVTAGLVASLNRPGRNVTGVSGLYAEIGPKRLELMHELVPSTSTVGLLVNPSNPGTETLLKDLRAAAPALGLQLQTLSASNEREFDAIFASLARLRVGALVVGNDGLFNSRHQRLVSLASQYSIPATYPSREFVTAGGLMGYGGSATDQYRLAGSYVGRVLRGEKPADLPVQQATRVEMIINLKTAKALGLTVPPNLLAIADEVIE